VASLEPKLFCSVAMKERFASCALAIADSYDPSSELLRHNNVKRLILITTAGQRLRTAEPVAALLMGIQTGVRNGKLYEAGNTHVKR
jgi:hypothetical protein